MNLFGIIDQDDLLAQTRTTLDGKFSLDVEESELFGHPDFYIVIHHTCVSNIFPKAVSSLELSDFFHFARDATSRHGLHNLAWTKIRKWR